MIGAALGVEFLKHLPQRGEWCVFDADDPETLPGPDPGGDGDDIDIIYETSPIFCSKFYQEAMNSDVPINPIPDGPHTWQGRNVFGTPRRVVCSLRIPDSQRSPRHVSRWLKSKRSDDLLVGEVVECSNQTGSSMKPQTLSDLRRLR